MSKPNKKLVVKKPTKATPKKEAKVAAKPEPEEAEVAPAPEEPEVQAVSNEDRKKEAQKHKALGNDFFKNQKYEEAIEEYTKAIAADDSDISFFSNRSGSYSSLGRHAEALKDAEVCIQKDSTFIKGYSRKALAQYSLKQYKEAAQTYQAGLRVDKNNENLKEGLEECLQKLVAAASASFNDPPPSQSKSEPKKEEKAPPANAEAVKEKEKGNDCYAKREFEEALTHYNKAIELDPENVVYYNNVAAVYFEQKEYGLAEEWCKKAFAIGEQQKSKHGISDYKSIAKAWARLGNVYNKQDKLDEAINAYNKSLLEDSNDATRKMLKKVEEAKVKKEKAAYLDPVKSEEAKKKGNESFAEGKWHEAIEHYSEALLRDPSNYKVYSNRAACYTKVMAWSKALEDCEACLEIDSNFSKIYLRKARIQYFLKQYHKALDTYGKGLALEPDSQEMREGKRQTLQAIQSENSKGEIDPQRRAEAMKDPEIQGILRDPTINKILTDLQAGSVEAQGALSDPEVSAKLQKLMAAGIISFGSGGGRGGRGGRGMSDDD